MASCVHASHAYAEEISSHTVSGPIWTSSLAEAVVALALPESDRAHYLLRHGSMRLGVYAPQGTDDQGPHKQDELYIIVNGRADFLKAEQRISAKVGDVLFVEANVKHRFENMEDDFAAWVIFWGPEGGEVPGRVPPL